MIPPVPILMYHQVMPNPPAAFRKYSVTPQMFRLQMIWLSLTGHTPVSMQSLRKALQGEKELPARPVVITFDDGFQSCVEHAVPILRARSFPAIFYLVAGLMGEKSDWLARERGVAFPLADWAQARTLVETGFECGAHSLTHPHLDRLPDAECLHELTESKKRLEDGVGIGIYDMAYPFGSYNDNVEQLAEQSGYESACTVQQRRACSSDRLLTLPRVPVTGYDSLLDFACRLRTAASLGEIVRGHLARGLPARQSGTTA